MYTNAVVQATAGRHDVWLECESFRASCERRVKKADSFDGNAWASHRLVREYEAARGVRRLKGAAAGLYSNVVALQSDDVVQLDCEAGETLVCSQRADGVGGNTVVQATTADRDGFHGTCGVYLVHALELVSLQREGIVVDEGELSVVVEEDGGHVPRILARTAMMRSNAGVKPASSFDAYSSFDLEVLSSSDVEQLLSGARPDTRDVNEQAAGFLPKRKTLCVNQSGLTVKAAKLAARSRLSGPPTPEIELDRRRSPSTDSVLSKDHQVANCSAEIYMEPNLLECRLSGAGDLLRPAEPRSRDGPACGNPQSNVPTNDKVAQPQPKARKRRFMPKIRSDKPKVRPAKKPKRSKAADEEVKLAVSPPVLILETKSPSLLQMKALARYKTPQQNKRRQHEPPSTPRGPARLESVTHDFYLLTPPSSPPSSPPSPHRASEWNEGISAPSTRRNLNFDTQEKEPALEGSEVVGSNDVQERDEPLGLIRSTADEESTHMAECAFTGFELVVRDQESLIPALSMKEAVPPEIDSSRTRVEELQIVAYDDGAKKMVVYKNPPMRKRTARYKPKVDLDFTTVKMFKTLSLKGTAEDDTEHDKASWEQSRQQWQDRARQFIDIMRQVQGSRAFSRWKGSVVDSVGGAFLTQNVSDFLSSNAFMSLRARFPARCGGVKEGSGNSTPMTTVPPPAEKGFSFPPRLERSTIVELHKPQTIEAKRQKEAAETVAALLSTVANENQSIGEALAETVSVSTRLWECHIEHSDHEEIDADAKQSNEVDVLRSSSRSLWPKSKELRIQELDTRQFLQPCSRAACATSFENAMEGASASEDHNLVTKSLPSTDTVINHSMESQCSKSLNAERNVDSMEAGMSSSLVPDDDASQALAILENELDPESPRTVDLADIKGKFANVVEDTVSRLTQIGKDKVLATTLRAVLGKTQTTREVGKAGKARALKTVKLRPHRALMRRRIENYRYRQGNLSFRLLSGEARAAWEAGFVMKSQKAKWEPLRARILADESYSRDPLTMDCVDWDAVQRASVHEVADVIKNRGMNNALAGRLKAFLDRVHRDQNGSIDLEWIRKLPPEDAKVFLLSFRGVGLKSVECIRLLTLHHPSFPVDTNVGRIAVRLGWVPLEPLPEETQLHLLELYPIQAHIQQYIWPRICTLDQETLYELHYQMITFGKVFCTKSKPNCNACPLRSECQHYASSYASAKLLLKWHEKQENQTPVLGSDAAAQVESTQHDTVTEDSCTPIIEQPPSPNPNRESSISDSIIPDIEEVPFRINYNRRCERDETQVQSASGFSLIIEEIRSSEEAKESSYDLNNYILEPDGFEDQTGPQVVELEDNDQVMEPEIIEMATLENTGVTVDGTEVIVEEYMDLCTITAFMAPEGAQIAIEETVVNDGCKHLPSQDLILLPPQSSLAPAPKLKNIQRLRTVHYVYELPDNHPLLFEMDQREADDPCFYLLAIWSPDEVPATIPKINDDDASNPFASCENDSEQTVRGTILIPCKTAMRGSFPLNGTYFQVNEVFADHASSMQPIDVPRTLLWSLRRRFVYFSTAVSNLFKDMSQDEIQCCFQKGYVCLRAFDMSTREPKVLAPRLHQSGAKIVKAPVSRRGRGRGTAWQNKQKDMKSKNVSTSKLTNEAPPTEITAVTIVTKIGL